MVFDLFINKLFSQREMAFDHTTQHILQKALALQPRCVPRWNAWGVFPKTVLKTFFFRRSLRAFRIRNTLLKRSGKKDNRPSALTHKKCSKETKCPSIPLERGSLVSYPKKVWRQEWRDEITILSFGDAWFRQVGRWKYCRPRCRYALSLNNRRKFSCQKCSKSWRV